MMLNKETKETNIAQKLYNLNRDLNAAKHRVDNNNSYNEDDEKLIENLKIDFDIAESKAIGNTNTKIKLDLINRQLNEFIKTIKFKKNGYKYYVGQLFRHRSFYTQPLSCLRMLILEDKNSGITGASLVYTSVEKEQIKNLDQFYNLLIETRNEFTQANNLFDIYTTFKRFENKVRINFLKVNN